MPDSIYGFPNKSDINVSLGTGGLIYDIGGYRLHVFLGDDTLLTLNTKVVEILMVGGGGGGGERVGGGGGAGAVLYKSSYVIYGGRNLPVVIGTGGLGATENGVSGSDGTSTTINGVSAIGGGGGGTYSGAVGRDGGSGGGGVFNDGAHGTATGAVTGWTYYGNTGGHASTGGPYGAGGGGGAGAVGADSAANQAGNGGAGIYFAQFIIPGISPTGYFAGGGGGGGGSTPSLSLGGSSIGGQGKNTNHYDPFVSNGIAHTGSGGGGSHDGSSDVHGGRGSSGILIIRYLYTP